MDAGACKIWIEDSTGDGKDYHACDIKKLISRLRILCSCES